MGYSHIAAATAAALAMWSFQGNRYEVQVAKLKLNHAAEIEQLTDKHEAQTRAAAELAKKSYEAVTNKYQGALNESKVRESALLRDLDVAHSESYGLRNQLSEAARRIATAPTNSVAEYATTTGELLAECSRSYQELAGKADGHASDVKTLIGTWPVIESP